MIKDFLKNSLIATSFILAFYFQEDSLGGGKHDYTHHIMFLKSFAEDFFKAYENFGLDQEKMAVRNSPIFYMIMSQFYKLDYSLNQLRLINFLSVILIILFFMKSLNLKYPTINLSTKILLSSILLLSPTIRTLAVWPYPFIWGLSFFVISVYYFLSFLNEKANSNRLKYALYNIFSLAISAYFTPNFSVFSIYYLYYFYLKFNFSKNFFKCVLLNILLSLPAILFIINKDFYLFKSDIFEISNNLKYNLSNKIIIISSFIILFYSPIINFLKINKQLTKINFRHYFVYLLLIFIILNSYFFNFTPNAGGGIFFHLSNTIFKNNFFILAIFFFTVMYFFVSDLYNKNNLILFLILIIYNLQYAIYYKYFDPLLYILLLFLFEIKHIKKTDIQNLKANFFVFYIIFLGLNLLKKSLEY